MLANDMPFNPFEGAFGLDISDKNIKLVRVHIKPTPFKTEFKLNAYGMAHVPAGAIEHGAIVKPQLVVKLLKELTKRTSLRASQNWVVAALPEHNTLLKYVTLRPGETVNDVFIKKLVADHFPYEHDELYLDWQLIPSAQTALGQPGLLLCAAPKHLADSYTYLLEVAGLSPIALEPASLALARCIIKAHANQQDTAQGILDIGASSSTLVLYDNNSVQFTRTFDHGGDTLTGLIANMLSLTPEQAGHEKMSRGANAAKYTRRQWSIIAREIEYLAHEIERAVMFYEKSGGRRVEYIHLCGGGCTMPGLDAYLSGKLKRMVRVGNPWQNLFTKELSPLAQKDLPAYAVAIGLALRAAGNPLVKLDEL